MKTAVLISGIPRHIDRGFPSLFNSIIAPNHADVFVHFWADPTKDQNIVNQVLSLYKPVKYLAEPPKNFVDTSMNLERMLHSYASSYKRDNFVNMTYSMWYGIQQVNLLKEVYRLENNIHYDYVVRARFDITYSRYIAIGNFDPNIIHISNRGLPHGMIDDRFAFGSNNLMNAYCGGFNFINYVFDIKDKLDGVFCGETIVYEMLTRLGIKYQTINDLNCAHLNHG